MGGKETMEYTKLGNSELKVSRICMGCMGFGHPSSGQHSWTLDEEQSRKLIRRALELGVNFSGIREAPARSIWDAACGIAPNGRMW